MPDDEPHTGALERPHTAPHYRRSPVTTISTARLPQREQTSRSRQSGTGVLGAVSFGHFGGIGFDSMAAFPTPDDEPNMGSRRTAERHRRAGLGFHLKLLDCSLEAIHLPEG